jgi:Subtilisin inhibitor-like
VRRLTLTCRPAGGTHPAPARACRRLFSNQGALRPVRREASCTGVYGGPQQALVRGFVDGRRIRALFKRSNGCEIARWNRLRPLFPVRTPPATTPDTNLEITVWPNGVGRGDSYSRTLLCGPAGGTLDHPARACDALMNTRAPFAETESERACTMIWGGPEQALVQGRFRGQRVKATFSRADGCEIDRWDKVAFLFAQ